MVLVGNYWPGIIPLTTIENSLKELSLTLHLKTEPHPASALEDLIAPVKESFGDSAFHLHLCFTLMQEMMSTQMK